VLYHLYSGQLLFSSAALFLAATAADLSGVLDARPLLGRVAGVLALLAIPLAGSSGTPMPAMLAIFALAATIAYIVAGFGARRRLRIALGSMAIVAVLMVCAAELPYHLVRCSPLRPSRIFVIGDSLSSGGFGERRPWPELLRIPVTNLARPSDTTAMALQNQIPLLPRNAQRNECVIIEIGGNDMLEGVPAGRFESALEGMLTAAGGRTVIMFELPLLPGRWHYGAIQRRLAAKHGVLLIPKRILARVLLGPGNTSDGIHLLQQGHQALAGELTRWLACDNALAWPVSSWSSPATTRQTGSTSRRSAVSTFPATSSTSSS